ncbi:uncharacterized protein TNCV_3215051 [Trichonephila clavipes]|nr:uncharacterized protein TNCV_3215051 [Trichonephila clavipes]
MDITPRNLSKISLALNEHTFMTVKDITVEVDGIELSVLRTFQNSGSSSPKRKEKCGLPLPTTEWPDISSESSDSDNSQVQGSDTEYKPSGADSLQPFSQLGVMKQFGKAIPKDGDCFKYPCKKFPGLSKAKLKEGIFVAPDILKLMKDNEFETCMTAKGKKAWFIFTDVTRKFIGNCKDPDCKECYK